MVYIKTHKTWDAELYKDGAGFVAELGEDLISILKPEDNENILDLGCGDGRLTRKIINYSNCNVMGIDSSQNLINAAKSIGINAVHQDARTMNYKNKFDAVLSNAALHWMNPISNVIENVSKSLKTKGRFVAECGGAGNIYFIRKELQKLCKYFAIPYKKHNPWVFLTSVKCQQILLDNGFKIIEFKHFKRPTPLQQDIDSWLTVFVDSFYSVLGASDQKLYINLLRNALEPYLYNNLYSKHKAWYIDYVRIRFNAVKDDST